MDEPIQGRVQVNGVGLTYFEWGRAWRGRGAPLLLAHATGFHARCWDQVVGRLGPRHVIALDQRGHGRSDKTAITSWQVFGRDLQAFLAALELRDVIGVGHSMGGYALVEAAAAAPHRVRQLLLLDPVIGPPEAYGVGWSAAAFAGGEHPTARRKRHFASPEEMFERFRARPPYAHFTAAALRDYCVHGLLPLPGGGYELACPPEIEASIYMTSLSHPGVHDSLRRLDQPVLVVRAQPPPAQRDAMDFSFSPTWPGLAAALRHGRDLHWPECTHFLPMQVPERVAALLT
ncbi:MAG: alpha/beta hydrolase [Deltaproteobacteria bacterium]|nr:alpha/beta hydrolase [Deltaproteobacteria bacterium]